MNNSTSVVCILMATYNGEKFIKQQIESIQCQTYENWILLIRDDKSTDETLKILNQLSQIDSRIKLISDNKPNLGVKKNFSELMKLGYRTNSHYFLLADQDDFWVKNKIEIMLKEISLRESSLIPHFPVLIYSDMEVVNEKLELIAPSFMNYQLLKHPKIHSLGQLLVQNTITGCASMFNKELLFIAKNIPDEAIVHDWWIALCASVSGRIYFLPTPLVKYRQHGNNQIGAKGVIKRFFPFSKNFYMKIKNSRNSTLRVLNQAISFHSINFAINNKYVIEIGQFGKINNLVLFERIKILIKLKIRRSTSLETLYIWIRLLVLKR
jgi:rhamnosyltransferase